MLANRNIFVYLWILFQLQQPNTMELRSGTYLQGDKYRIERTLGRGGFGVTYLAVQGLMDRNVCIKEFFPKGFYNRESDTLNLTLASQSNAATMEQYKQKFLKEAKTIAKLNHQHIIRIIDVFQENNTAYYVMEYINGESLADIVRREGALDESRALHYIHALISATEYIHDRNIMHLDIKPGNIMIRKEDNFPILIDFGLSKQYDEGGMQTSSTPVGISHGFAPLEQYQAGGVSTFSPGTDIYSIGATLYYLVMGKVPPTAANIVDDGLGELPKTLSSGTTNAIIQSMQSRRKDRPASVKALLNILDGDKPEYKQISFSGWLIEGIRTIGGRLIITSDQLIFHVNRFVIFKSKKIYKFNIKDIERINTDCVRPYLVRTFDFDIIFKDGSVVSFQAWSKRRIIDELEARRKQL